MNSNLIYNHLHQILFLPNKINLNKIQTENFKIAKIKYKIKNNNYNNNYNNNKFNYNNNRFNNNNNYNLNHQTLQIIQ